MKKLFKISIIVVYLLFFLSIVVFSVNEVAAPSELHNYVPEFLALIQKVCYLIAFILIIYTVITIIKCYVDEKKLSDTDQDFNSKNKEIKNKKTIAIICIVIALIFLGAGTIVGAIDVHVVTSLT